MKAKRAEMIKIGKGSFALPYVLSFESKREFVDACLYLAEGFHSSPTEYLESIWDLAHRNDDFKTAQSVNNAADVNPDEPTSIVEAPETTKVSHKRKSTSKKE